MNYECCSIQKLRFEMESWISYLEKNEILKIEIKKCPVLKGTYDLVIKKEVEEE